MRKIWPLFQYYFIWQPMLVLILVLGLVAFVLKILFIGYSDSLVFVLGLAAFSFLLLVPFCSGSTALRGLISNPHASMVPYFRLHAGIAYMLIAVIASIYLYLNFVIFGTGEYSPLVMLRTFYCLSLFAGFMQLALPSRFFIPIISLSPFVFMMILMNNREILGELFMNPGVTIAMFVLSLLGWGYGLNLLATRDNFRPVCKDINNTQAWATYDGGLFNRLPLGRSRTAEGTLLLGYPDNWGGIIVRVIYFSVMTPVFTTGGMHLIGIADDLERGNPIALAYMFLFISLFSAVFCVFMYGEHAARARLLWLRYGTDRLNQWRLVDYYSLRILAAYFACGAVIAFTTMLVSGLPLVHIGHYLLMLAGYSCFNLYFSMLVKALNLSPLLLVLVIIATVGSFAIGLYPVLRGSGSFFMLTSVELLLLAGGLALRLWVKHIFTGIDWKLVKISTRNRYALTQD